MSEMNRVALWNTTAGKPKGAGTEELMRSQMLMLVEEVTGVDELYASYRNNKEHGLLDGIGDVIVVAVGALHLLGFDNFKVLPAQSNIVDKDIDELVDEIYFLANAIKEDPLRLDPSSVAMTCIEYCVDICHIKGYDPEEVLRIVNDSNFSKFCKTVEEARASKAAYTKKKRYSNVTYTKIGKYYVLSGDDEIHGAKQKTLKSINFYEPCFLNLIEQVNPQALEGKL